MGQNLLDLSAEVIAEVIEWLNPPDIVQLMVTCKKLHSISDDRLRLRKVMHLSTWLKGDSKSRDSFMNFVLKYSNEHKRSWLIHKIILEECLSQKKLSFFSLNSDLAVLPEFNQDYDWEFSWYIKRLTKQDGLLEASFVSIMTKYENSKTLGSEWYPSIIYRSACMLLRSNKKIRFCVALDQTKEIDLQFFHDLLSLSSRISLTVSSFKFNSSGPKMFASFKGRFVWQLISSPTEPLPVTFKVKDLVLHEPADLSLLKRHALTIEKISVSRNTRWPSMLDEINSDLPLLTHFEVDGCFCVNRVAYHIIRKFGRKIRRLKFEFVDECKNLEPYMSFIADHCLNIKQLTLVSNSNSRLMSEFGFTSRVFKNITLETLKLNSPHLMSIDAFERTMFSFRRVEYVEASLSFEIRNISRLKKLMVQTQVRSATFCILEKVNPLGTEPFMIACWDGTRLWLNK